MKLQEGLLTQESAEPTKEEIEYQKIEKECSQVKEEIKQQKALFRQLDKDGRSNEKVALNEFESFYRVARHHQRLKEVLSVSQSRGLSFNNSQPSLISVEEGHDM